MHQERKSPKVSWARMYQIIASILLYLIITLQCRNRHYYSTLSRIFLENSFDSNCWKMMNLDLEFGWNKDPFLSIKVLVNQFYLKKSKIKPLMSFQGKFINSEKCCHICKIFIQLKVSTHNHLIMHVYSHC